MNICKISKNKSSPGRFLAHQEMNQSSLGNILLNLLFTFPWINTNWKIQNILYTKKLSSILSEVNMFINLTQKKKNEIHENDETIPV